MNVNAWDRELQPRRGFSIQLSVHGHVRYAATAIEPEYTPRSRKNVLIGDTYSLCACDEVEGAGCVVRTESAPHSIFMSPDIHRRT